MLGRASASIESKRLIFPLSFIVLCPFFFSFFRTYLLFAAHLHHIFVI